MASKRNSSLLWIYILLLTAALFACVQKSDPDISTPALSLSPPEEVHIADANIPITGNDDRLSTGQPQIIEIRFPEAITSQAESGDGYIHFSDTEGDIYTAQFTCTDCGCMDFEFFAFDPTTALESGDHFDGTFCFRQSCLKCPGSSSDHITMQVQLFDLAGNASQPAEYQFTCR